MIPWPELPAVCVARQLQVKPRAGRCLRSARLVRQKHADGRVNWSASQGSNRITAVRFVKVVRAVVGHAIYPSNVYPSSCTRKKLANRGLPLGVTSR